MGLGTGVTVSGPVSLASVDPGQCPDGTLLPGFLLTTPCCRVRQHHMCMQLLQLLVQQVKTSSGAPQQQLHRGQVAAQVSGGSPQVLSALLQLQLFPDFPLQPLSFQLQLLLHPGGCQVCASQTQLLQQRPAARLTLQGDGHTQKVRTHTSEHRTSPGHSPPDPPLPHSKIPRTEA